MKKKLTILFVFLIFPLFLIGCNQKYIISIEPGTDGYIVTYSDGTISNLSNNINLQNNVELRTNEGYIQYKSGDNEWSNLISIKDLTGAVGENGENILLNVSDDYIQWKYANDTEWTNLISLEELKGANGTNGTNGTNGANGADGENGKDLTILDIFEEYKR